MAYGLAPGSWSPAAVWTAHSSAGRSAPGGHAREVTAGHTGLGSYYGGFQPRVDPELAEHVLDVRPDCRLTYPQGARDLLGAFAFCYVPEDFLLTRGEPNGPMSIADPR